MAEKASRRFHRVCNPDGAAVSTASRALIQKDGLTFKDIDGSGTLSPVNDWRLFLQNQSGFWKRSMQENLQKKRLPSCLWPTGAWPNTRPAAPWP